MLRFYNIINLICNIVLAICALLGLFKYVGIIEWTPQIKIPNRNCIFKKVWYLNNALQEEKKIIIDVLTTFKPITDASEIFSRESDEKLFLNMFGNGNPKISADLNELFSFYNKLSIKGKKEFEDWYNKQRKLYKKRK